MKKNWAKYLSVLLSVLMLVGMLTVGVNAFANDTGTFDPGQWGGGFNGPTQGGFNPAPNNPAPNNPNFPPLYNPTPSDDYEEEEDDKIDIVVRKKMGGRQ